MSVENRPQNDPATYLKQSNVDGNDRTNIAGNSNLNEPVDMMQSGSSCRDNNNEDYLPEIKTSYRNISNMLTTSMVKINTDEYLSNSLIDNKPEVQIKAKDTVGLESLQGTQLIRQDVPKSLPIFGTYQPKQRRRYRHSPSPTCQSPLTPTTPIGYKNLLLHTITQNVSIPPNTPVYDHPKVFQDPSRPSFVSSKAGGSRKMSSSCRLRRQAFAKPCHSAPGSHLSTNIVCQGSCSFPATRDSRHVLVSLLI